MQSESRDNNLNKSSVTNDMATALKVIGEFSGAGSEDARKWIEEAIVTIRTIKITEEEALTVLVLGLRGEARTWYTNLVKTLEPTQICFQIFKDSLIRRFSNQSSNEEITRRFLTNNTMKTQEEY